MLPLLSLRRVRACVCVCWVWVWVWVGAWARAPQETLEQQLQVVTNKLQQERSKTQSVMKSFEDKESANQITIANLRQQVRDHCRRME